MHRSILAAVSCLVVATSALAEEEPLPNFAEDTLSGDWGGSRSAAAKKGFLFEGGVKVDALHNRGALKDGSKTVSHVDLKLKMDLEKAAGWQGGSAFINIISDAGTGHNATNAPSWMGISNLEVPAPTTTRLFHAWVQQTFLDGNISVRAGIYPIDSEFQIIDSGSVFIKPEFGPTAELALTRGPSVFNNAAFGIRTKLESTDKTLYAQWALMDGIPNDPAHPKRTAIRFARGDGAFNIGEIGWLPEAGNDKFQGHAKLAVGLWGYTSRVDDLIDTDVAANPVQRRSRGGYALAEKTLVRLGGDEDRYISGFIRPSWTDGDSTPLKNTVNLGLMVKGPVASRPDDIIGLAWSQAKLSNKWRAAQLPTPTANSEDALEVTYRYLVTPWFAIQPNYQHVRNPGGRTDIPAARLIGARFELIL